MWRGLWWWVVFCVLVFGLEEVYWHPSVLSSRCGSRSLSKFDTLVLSFMIPLLLAILWSTLQFSKRLLFHELDITGSFTSTDFPFPIFGVIMCMQVWRARGFLRSEKMPIRWECQGSCSSSCRAGKSSSKLVRFFCSFRSSVLLLFWDLFQLKSCMLVVFFTGTA